MKNKIFALLLFFPVVILAGYMLRLNYMSSFEKVEVAVQGYDPKDFFAGYYMYLRPDWEETDCTQFEKNICPMEDFEQTYTFYIKHAQSNKLSEKVNTGDVKLQFSYSKGGFRPIITDLLIDGKSFLQYLQQSD